MKSVALLKGIFFMQLLFLLLSCNEKKVAENRNFPRSIETVDPEKLPDRENLWVFMLAGQSNMAGYSRVEPSDTIADKRILSVNAGGQLIYAKEPLHFYEPGRNGLSCGLSFGKTLIAGLPDSISVLLLPVAVGGSKIQQWLGDSLHLNVKLLSNFREKVAAGLKYGTIKAVLWHQGESDAKEELIGQYGSRLKELFTRFRTIIKNDSLPILIGELGTFSTNNKNWQRINSVIHAYSLSDSNTAVIGTGDLEDDGDKLHFNSEGERIMGRRFANEYLKHYQKNGSARHKY
jgi:hypothetical protein